MIHALSASPSGDAIPKSPPAKGKSGADNAGTAFLALLAAVGNDASPEADTGQGNISADGSGTPLSNGDGADASSLNGTAGKGTAHATTRRDAKSVLGSDDTEHGMPVLPQPQPISLPQPLQAKATSDGAATAAFPDRVQGHPIMLPGKESMPVTGVMHPLGAYQPDSLDAPPGDAAPQGEGRIGGNEGRNVENEGRNQLRPYSPSADVEKFAGALAQTDGRDMSRPYAPGTGTATNIALARGVEPDAAVMKGANMLQRTMNGQGTPSGQNVSVTAAPKANAAFAAFSTTAAAQPAETPPLHPQMGRGSGGGATTPSVSIASASVAPIPPPAAFALAAADTAPFATRTDRRDTTIDAPTSTPMPGSPGARTASATSAANVNHPAIPMATARIVATAQSLPRGATAELQLRLRPPNLGDVQVILRRGDSGNLAVQLIPATHAAADALGANLHHLRAALDAHSTGQHADVTLHHPTGEHDARQHSSGQHAPTHDEEEVMMPTPSAGATMHPAPGVSSARLPTRTGAGIDYTA